MDNNQLTRIDNCKKDIRVTNFTNKCNFYIFDVTIPSTLNTYVVKLNKVDKTLSCNCPDGRFKCRKLGVVCKHSCYVLLKILPFNFRKGDSKLSCYNPGKVIQSDFFVGRNKYMFTREEMDMIKCTLKWRYRSAFSKCNVLKEYVSYMFGL